MPKFQLIDANNIKVSYGEQEVLNFETFKLYEGDKVGLVGANGAGKTTLLKVLSGEIKQYDGTVKLKCEPFYFKQADETWDTYDLDGGEIKRLGIKDKIWNDVVSGGENTRIRLAMMFSVDRAVAFLDEPTANLDMKGRELLAERMKRMDSFLVVSHDRAFLNEVCTKIVEVEDGKLNEYPGNYDDYEALKQAELDRKWYEYEEYTKEKKRLTKVASEKRATARNMTKKPQGMSYSEFKMRNFIGHHTPGDRALQMDKSANNVLKRIEHLEAKEKPKELPKIRPDFRLTNPPENPIVIRGEHVNKAYDDGNIIFEDASFMIYNNSKVAILGDNGAGKTTLLNMIMDRESVSVVPKAHIGYLSQNVSEIDLNRTVLENAMRVSIQKEDITRSVLARLLLSNRDINKLASELSGGERMKLALAMLLVSDVNMLVLDEPTNYMDIPSIEAIELLLQEYEGTLLFVSHDMEFVKNIATDKLLVKDGKIRSLRG